MSVGIEDCYLLSEGRDGEVERVEGDIGCHEGGLLAS